MNWARKVEAVATKTKEKLPVDVTAEQDEEAAAALHRVKTRAAIDLSDLAALTGVHYSTLRRKAWAEELPKPLVATRIGQRWIVPSAQVRELLCLDGAIPVSGDGSTRNPFVLEV